MFENLKAQERASRLKFIEGSFAQGILLYSELIKADRAREPRLAIKLNEWYSRLTSNQQYDFCAIVCKEGQLGLAMQCFKGKVLKW